jgi:hypothetical protein
MGLNAKTGNEIPKNSVVSTQRESLPQTPR